MDTSAIFRLDGLAELGSRSRVDMRPTLIRVLTDLYVQKLSHTPDEERHYTELALRLLDAVDVTTRTAVAARLARHLSPPIRIIQRLASDLPEVAAALQIHPLLQPSRHIAETAPHPLPQSAPTAAATAPPERNDENQSVATALHPVDEEPTDSRAAPGAMDWAAAQELNELFFAANAEERRLILLNIDVVAPIAAEQVAISRDPDIERRLETTALARNREGFAQHLAAALRIPRAQAQRIVRDELGEPIVTAAKALGVPRDVLYRILMFLNPAVGHSVERVHALATLYDEMTPRAAEDIVAIWQGLQRGEAGVTRHQPLSWNDEVRPRARPAAVAQRAAPAAPAARQRRDAS